MELLTKKDLIIFGMGIISAIINTLAGGGSLLTLPLLIFYGLEANVANATNRISIVLQSITGTMAFHKKKLLDVSGGIYFSIPALFGALLGSYFAVDIDNELLEKSIAVIMIIILFTIIFKPERFLKGTVTKKKTKLNKKEILISFIIGLYAGFIQAGVGYLMLFGLVTISRYNLLAANALKLFLTLILNALALSVFIYYDLILWRIGLILALGSIIGTLIGAKLAILGGIHFIRYAFIGLLVVFILSLLGIINLNFYQ